MEQVSDRFRSTPCSDHRMKLRYTACMALTVHFLGSALAQQNLGMITGLQRSVWRAPGHVFDTHDRLELGFFSAMQLHSNLALRNELAFCLGREVSNARIERARLATMVKYYPRPAFYVLLGAEMWIPLGTVDPQEVGPELPPQRMDLAIFTGAGTRFSDRSEVGLRAGIGMLVSEEMPIYGKARDHSLSIVYGYLLKGRLPGFTKRRQWKRQVRSTPLI